MSRNKQPLTIEHAILGFLRRQPMHGYELYQRLSAPDALGSVWPLKQSQFYALVSKLEEAGYLTTSLELRGSMPPRKMLQLTATGEVAFAAWLNGPPDPTDEARIDVLARLYFAQQAGPAAALNLLMRQRSLSRAALRDLRAQLLDHAAPHSYPWLVLQWRARQTEAWLDWIDTISPPLPTTATVSYPIAVLADSPSAALARQFVAYVCGAAGQALLTRYGFLPAAEMPPDPPLPAARTQAHGNLLIFAAASLTDAFTALGAAFSAATPGATLRFNFGGSQRLADDLAQGAQADVFAPAHRGAMDSVIAAGRVAADRVCTFAHNQLAVVTSAQHPAQLSSLGDLAKPGLKLALGSEASAIGRYTHDLLSYAAQFGSFGAAGEAAVLHNVVYYAETVTGVLAKVAQGEVDAGIVFTSDYQRASGEVQVSLVPPLR